MVTRATTIYRTSRRPTHAHPTNRPLERYAIVANNGCTAGENYIEKIIKSVTAQVCRTRVDIETVST